jgi:hypothetical protein
MTNELSRGGFNFSKRWGDYMYTILVQMAEEKWTMEAMHLACALAHSTGAQVALLRLVQVQHPSYLGTSFGDKPPDKAEYQRLKEYAATAEDYGAELIVYWMQCISSLDAMVQAAENLDATIVFARVKPTWLTFWHKFQVWNLKRMLMTNRRQVFTLDEPTSSMEWTPSITVKAIPVRKPRPKYSHQPIQNKHV